MIYKEFYAGMEWAALPVVALLFFLIAFTLILLRTFAARRRQDFDAVAARPLSDGIPNPPPTRSEVRP
jgi:hypothetical protein